LELLASGDYTEAELGRLRRYATSKAANAGEGQKRRDSVNGTTYRNGKKVRAKGRKRPVKYWFDKGSKRAQSHPDNFVPGPQSTLVGPFESALDARVWGYENGPRVKSEPLGETKAVPTPGTDSYTKSNPATRGTGVKHSKKYANKQWAQIGKPGKGGVRAWALVEGPRWNTLIEGGGMLDGHKLNSSHFRKYSTAEKEGMSKSSQAKGRKLTDAERKEKNREAGERLKALKKRDWVLCVFNPNSSGGNRAVGVEDANGRTTDSARRLASIIGGLKAATKKLEKMLDSEETQYEVDDRTVINLIKDLIRKGKLTQAMGGKCAGTEKVATSKVKKTVKKAATRK
ncbi:MAG: hypothetical protein ACMG6E_05995, partial [Candidatus Roizmanbacteria bacterium]